MSTIDPEDHLVEAVNTLHSLDGKRLSPEARVNVALAHAMIAKVAIDLAELYPDDRSITDSPN